MIFAQGKLAASVAIPGQPTFTAVMDGTQGTIKCCNQSSVDDRIRVAVVPAIDNLADNDKHWIVYDLAVPGNGQLAESFEIDYGDKLYILSNNGTTSYTISGYQGV